MKYSLFLFLTNMDSKLGPSNYGLITLTASGPRLFVSVVALFQLVSPKLPQSQQLQQRQQLQQQRQRQRHRDCQLLASVEGSNELPFSRFRFQQKVNQIKHLVVDVVTVVVAVVVTVVVVILVVGVIA